LCRDEPWRVSTTQKPPFSFEGGGFSMRFTVRFYHKKGKQNATKKENKMPQKRKMKYVSN